MDVTKSLVPHLYLLEKCKSYSNVVSGVHCLKGRA